MSNKNAAAAATALPSTTAATATVTASKSAPSRQIECLVTFSFRLGVVEKFIVHASSAEQFRDIVRSELKEIGVSNVKLSVVAKRGTITPLAEVPFTSIGKTVQLFTSRVSKPARVAVLGGSFDPITDGHLKMACEIINSRCADEVWIVPCGPRPDKPSLKTPVFHRYIMCHLAVDTTFGARFPVKVCDFEVHEKKALATYHLMSRLRKEHPDKDFYFVIGTDLIADIRSWPAPGVANAGQKLLDENKFLVVNRPGFLHKGELPANFVRLQPAEGDNITLVGETLSSSEVRARLRPSSMRRSMSGFSNGDEERAAIQGGNFMRAEGLVPSAVLAHIIRYKLYQTANSPRRRQ